MPSVSRNVADKFTLPADPNFFSFPRSDGDLSSTPHSTDPTPAPDGSVNFYKFQDLDSPASMKWRVGAGTAVAKALGYDLRKTWVLDDFPKNYRFYDHHKGPEDAPRHDLYLFGGPSRFRSINEFIPHAIWLFQSENTRCECKYCSKGTQKDISAKFVSRGLIPASASPSPSRGPSIRTEKRKEPVKSRLRDHKVYVAVQKAPQKHRVGKHVSLEHAMVVERNQDLRDVNQPDSSIMKQRRLFREGEVVWCELPSLIRGPIGGDDDIQFWPALVDGVSLACDTVPNPAASGSGQSSMDPDSENFVPPWITSQSNLYRVKLIGTNCDYTLPDTNVLPHLTYTPHGALIKAMIAVSPSTLVFDREALASFSPINKENPDEPPPFESCVAAYALAIQIGAQLAEYWTVTDEWTFTYTVPHSLITPQVGAAGLAATINSLSMQDSISSGPRRQPGTSFEVHTLDPSAPQTEVNNIAANTIGSVPVGLPATQTRYQGLWWGAERIWVDELVRLKVARRAIAPDGAEHILAPAGPGKSSAATIAAEGNDPALFGSHDRGVFMRIDGLFVVEVPTNTGVKKECRASGMLYDLVDDDWDDPANGTANPSGAFFVRDPTLLNSTAGPSASNVASGSKLSSALSSRPPVSKLSTSTNSQLSHPAPSANYRMPNAPEGYRFRPILEDGYECVLSLTMISGRYYPRILTHPLLHTVVTESLDASTANGGLAVSSRLWSLEGLSAGHNNSVEPVRFMNNRTKMVEDAEKISRDKLTRHVQTVMKSEESMEVDGPGNL